MKVVCTKPEIWPWCMKLWFTRFHWSRGKPGNGKWSEFIENIKRLLGNLILIDDVFIVKTNMYAFFVLLLYGQNFINQQNKVLRLTAKDVR